MAQVKISFDSLTLAAVLCELREYQGAKVQKVVQPDEHTIQLIVYAAGKEAALMLSCDPVFARMHFVTRRATNHQPMLQFCAALRARLDGSRLTRSTQVGFDRIVRLDFEGPHGNHRIVGEFMGKHSNLILLDASGKVVSAAKWISRSKSKRPILPGKAYEPPPFPPRASILGAASSEHLKEFEGASPILLKLIDAQGLDWLHGVRERLQGCRFEPVLISSVGAYPVSVSALDLEEVPRASISIALEQHFDSAARQWAAETLRHALLGQLARVLLAREVAAQDLSQALDTSKRASEFQLQGELILVHAHEIPASAPTLSTEGYDGTPVEIRLDPELTSLENAERLFKKAKRAKASGPLVQEQLSRISQDVQAIRSLMAAIEAEDRLERLESLREQASKKRWLISRPVQTSKKEERPYEGHRVREALGPGGVMVLYGENAEANDYLIVRVAKPNDYWLHVRGSQSAHAVIQTQNHPEKIGREVLEFAARIVVQHSPSKHSGYVPVDYTLRKYVRKPKGSAKGMAVYTHEKTLHIESKG